MIRMIKVITRHGRGGLDIKPRYSESGLELFSSNNSCCSKQNRRLCFLKQLQPTFLISSLLYGQSRSCTYRDKKYLFLKLLKQTLQLLNSCSQVEEFEGELESTGKLEGKEGVFITGADDRDVINLPQHLGKAKCLEFLEKLAYGILWC